MNEYLQVLHFMSTEIHRGWLLLQKLGRNTNTTSLVASSLIFCTRQVHSSPWQIIHHLLKGNTHRFKNKPAHLDEKKSQYVFPPSRLEELNIYKLL